MDDRIVELTDTETPAAEPRPPHTARTLSIIVPTYNERDNVRPLTQAIAAVMGAVAWEAIFVDDDSPDGTAAAVLAVAREGYPVRCLRRIGRRGLSSAVVEGALAADADVIAVIDGDMQHDESLLPKMLALIQADECDVVVGSRHAEGGGGTGMMAADRAKMSDLATRMSALLVGKAVSDPMSGYFMIRRDVFEASVYDLSQQGYKILLDILSSSPRDLRVKELSYTFRERRAGTSKLDILVVAEYGFLLIDKLTNGLIPPRFVFFAAVGGLGLLVHLSVLYLLKGFGDRFLVAQGAAVSVAMTFNYVVNNYTTYRDQRLKGWSFLIGYFIFAGVCSIGALANVGVAELAIRETGSWTLAGIAGALMGSVFNFGVATRFVWARRRRRSAQR